MKIIHKYNKSLPKKEVSLKIDKGCPLFERWEDEERSAYF